MCKNKQETQEDLDYKVVICGSEELTVLFLSTAGTKHTAGHAVIEK